MRISSLRSFLRSLCCNSPWNYAAFWKLKYQSEMVLTWEDSFCDITKQRESVVPVEDFCLDSLDDVLYANFNSRSLDGSLGEHPIELAVAEMSSAFHVFGKGVVGVAALTGVPRWIYSDNIAADVFDSIFSAEYPDEWLLQFVAGIKSILLLPVIPHGVLQLGSVEMVAEDAMLVSFVRQSFDSYKRCDRYDAVCAIQKSSLMPTELENLEEPSIISMNNRNEDGNTIHSSGSDSYNIFVADQMVPAFMFQDLCDPFIAGLENSYGNLIDKESGLQSLGHLTCEEDKYEVSGGVLFKPSCLNVKARPFPLCDNFQLIKHGEFLNDVGDFYFKEGSIHPNSISNNFFYDCETGGTLLNIPSELQKASRPAVVGHSDRIYDRTISGHNSLWSSINDRDLTCWMDLSGEEYAASTQENDEMEHLVETVVGDAYSSTDDTSLNQPNPAPAIKMSPGKVFASSPKNKIRNKRIQNDSGKGNTALFSFFTSAFVDTGINTVSGLSPSASSSESTITELIDKQQQRRKGNHLVNQRKVSRLSSTHKINLYNADNQRTRPRDRQLIQDRIKELRDLVPNSDKCSIDGLLDKTIKHMLFLRDVTNQADKLRHQVLKEETNNNTSIKAEGNRVHQNGTSWAVELGAEHHQCPITVKDLDKPGQMLIEMMCDDHGRFLEIADVIQRLQLTILKAVMEKCSENSWAHFIVEAKGSFQRVDLFWPLMKLLRHR